MRCGNGHKLGDNWAVEAAFFDLDKTIIAKSGPLALGRSFFREGLIDRGTLMKSLYAQLMFQLIGADEDRMERMRAEAGRLTAGWEADKVRRVVTEVLEEVFAPLVFAEAVDLIGEHKAAGRAVCIVSSSPEVIVEPLGRMLNVDRVIATRPQVKDGRYTGELEFYAYGANKAVAMREMAGELDIDLEASFAYSDSITDLPMLEVVGHPVAVNPDRELRRIAVERGWAITSFKSPVSLRSRLPSLPGPRASLINGLAAAAAVAGVAGLAWWMARRKEDGGSSRSPSPAGTEIRREALKRLVMLVDRSAHDRSEPSRG